MTDGPFQGGKNMAAGRSSRTQQGNVNMSTVNTTLNDDRAAWVEPSIIVLDVAETANQKGSGKDAGSPGPDFSLS